MGHWVPGRWYVRRARPVVIAGNVVGGWSITFPNLVNGLPRTARRASHAEALRMIDQAIAEGWAGA